jgi:uncharacterized membrane protein YbhN (UPF0104 family)
MPEKLPNSLFSKIRGNLVYLLIVFPVILIILVLIFLDILFRAFRQADYSDLVLALGLFLLSAILITTKYWVLLDGKVGFTRLLRSDGLSYFINQFIPIPTEALRVTGLHLIADAETGWASAMIILDFLLNFFMRLVACVVVLQLPAVHKPHIKILSSSVAFLVMTGILIWFYNNPEKVRTLIRSILFRVPFVKKEEANRYAVNLAEALRTVRIGQLVTAWLISLAIWVLFAAFFYEGLAIFNISLPFLQAATMALLALILSPPSTPIMIIFQQIVVSVGLLALKVTSPEYVIVYAFIIQGIQIFVWLIPAIWAVTSTKTTLAKLTGSAQEYMPRIRFKRIEGRDH